MDRMARSAELGGRALRWSIMDMDWIPLGPVLELSIVDMVSGRSVKRLSCPTPF